MAGLPGADVTTAPPPGALVTKGLPGLPGLTGADVMSGTETLGEIQV